MESNVRVVAPEVFMEQLPELLQLTDSVPLVISGNSMIPFLVHRRDTVYLSKVTKPPKRGAVVLYQRESGAYVLHRIYRKRNGLYDLVGDAQQEIETSIRPDQIMAEVKAVRRNGRLLRRGSLCWLFYEKIWLSLLPFRPLIGRVYSCMKAWRNDK